MNRPKKLISLCEQEGEHLWICLGDQSEYEDFGDDFYALADYLCNYQIEEIDRWVERGFESGNFSGHNYVSLYWGDCYAEFISELSKEEKKELEKLLEG
jgi:hypothetical protein